MLCNSVIDKTNEGFLLRVRLQPNSSSCQIKDVFCAPDGDYLKISICAAPEKGKANKELIDFLAKKLKIAKSSFEIVSGELDKYKKISIKTNITDKDKFLEQLLKS